MVSRNVRVIGIDLGTTYSSVGFWIGENLIIRKISSCMAFTDSGEPIIDNPTKLDLISSSFEVIADPVSKNDEPNVIVRSCTGWKRFFAEELLSMIIKKLKQIAAEILGLENDFNAVISVPSCYNNAQRLAAKRAATMAGFGETHFTDLLYRHCSRHFNNSFRLRSKSRLRFACEDAKKDPSNPNVTQTKVDVETYYVRSPKEFLGMRTTLTQDAFDRECKELFDKCQEAIFQCLQYSGVYQVHEVILVGGSTRIPRIQEMLRAFCSNEKGLCDILEPDKGVVLGAAIQAAVLSGDTLSNPLMNGISIADVTPLSLSTKTTQEVTEAWNKSLIEPWNNLSMPGISIRTATHIRQSTLTLPNLIPRNTMIPTEIEHGCIGAINSPSRYYFEVHEGEEEMMEKNHLIGYFIFEMGEPNITVSFAVDRDGILNVTAVEDESRRQLVRRVINRSLTTDELNNLGRDIMKPEYEVEEESKRQKLEAKAKVWLFVNKHRSREVPDFSPSQVKKLSTALADAEGWLNNNELPEVEASELKLDELERIYFLILHKRGPQSRE
ncbi:hypothetical protein MKX01_000471 [Papaver californicum]|nr:hypothetical protein MKX01_000471 [Papaver californicum]